jgi:hypothetical protein
MSGGSGNSNLNPALKITQSSLTWTIRSSLIIYYRLYITLHKEENSVSTTPSHIAYVVTDPKEEGGKATWREVGAVWKHRNGTGFDLVVHDQLAVSGRIVCTERRERTNESRGG